MSLSISKWRTPLVLLVVLLLGGASAAPPDAKSKASTALRPGPHRDVTISTLANGVFEIAVTGASPHFWSQKVQPPPPERRVLAFDYFSTSGIASFSVRFRNPDGDMVLVGSKALPLAETWQPMAVELSALPEDAQHFHFSLKQKLGGDLRLRNFCLREPGKAEIAAREVREKRNAARKADAEAFRNYLNASYDSKIGDVLVGESSITITGRMASAGALVELPIHVASHEKSTLPPRLLDTTGDFSVEVPRLNASTGRDRALSRWQLRDNDGAIVSLAKWPTRVDKGVADGDLPELVGRSQKGIGGVPSIRSAEHPIFELGVEHATVNFVLDALLHAGKRPG